MNMDDDNQEDWTDARGQTPAVPQAVVSGLVDSDYYNMNHPKRGKCLIFNNKDFDPHLKLNVREGTEVDSKALQDCFGALNFEVYECKNYGKQKLLATLKEVAKEDHSDSDCFACCILTHGNEWSLSARDGKLLTEEVFKPFRGDGCTTLAGKPKLFFIQACRGGKLDPGVKVKFKESTDSGEVCKIPTQADFLIVYSTVPGYCAFLNMKRGSWFIQELCGVLREYASEMDLLEMTTIVNHRVAYNYESYAPQQPDKNKMKEVPFVTSTLTRKIVFC